MEKYYFIAILVVCIGIFVLAVLTKKMELFINFVLRLFAGAVGIYVVNSILTATQFGCLVGLNGLNMLAVGLLGFPGFCLLYVVSIFFRFWG